MKKRLILLLFICVSSNCLSQINEIGFFLGGVNYVGDVGPTNYIRPNNTGGAILYKYNLNPRIAIRGNFSYFSFQEMMLILKIKLGNKEVLVLKTQ